MNNYCKYGENCANFAHRENELKNRKMSFNYKTKPCKKLFFENSFVFIEVDVNLVIKENITIVLMLFIQNVKMNLIILKKLMKKCLKDLDY